MCGYNSFYASVKKSVNFSARIGTRKMTGGKRVVLFSWRCQEPFMFLTSHILFLNSSTKKGSCIVAAPIINRAPRKILTGGEQSEGREGKKENLTIA
jgi:hypothetical protein